MERDSGERLRQLTFILLFSVLLLYVLVMARESLYPIFSAIFFAYLLYPIEKWLETEGLPRILANFIAVMIDEISNVMKHYMPSVVIVILILCVIKSTGLFMIGVGYWLHQVY